MFYSDFTKIEQVVTALDLTVEDIPHLFSQIPIIEPSQRLKETLEECLDLAASISTEKARSELIITPILLEIRRLFKNKIGYFSGNTFNIDASKGLTGACDLLLESNKLKSAFSLEQLQTKQVATYPSNELTYTLDYIFYNSERIEFIESQLLKEAKMASDHIPIMMKFRLR